MENKNNNKPFNPVIDKDLIKRNVSNKMIRTTCSEHIEDRNTRLGIAVEKRAIMSIEKELSKPDSKIYKIIKDNINKEGSK